MLPRFYQFIGATKYGMDAHSYDVILYELTENKKAEPAQNDGESIEAVIKRGSLPEISAVNPCGDLIRKMGSSGKGGEEVMKPAVDFFKASLLPDVEQYSLWTYNGWLSYGKAHLVRRPKSISFLRHISVGRQTFERIVNNIDNLSDILVRVLSWLDSSDNQVDTVRRSAFLAVLRDKSTFNQPSIFAPDDRPPCRSLFTTAIYSLEGVEEIQELDSDGDAVVCECRTAIGLPVRKDKIKFEVVSDVGPVIYFFRQLISQLYLERPAFQPLLRWNIAIGSTASELCLFSEIVRLDRLRLPTIRKLSATQKTIFLYGVAREMLHL
jgi:hypothetical protein